MTGPHFQAGIRTHQFLCGSNHSVPRRPFADKLSLRHHRADNRSSRPEYIRIRQYISPRSLDDRFDATVSDTTTYTSSLCCEQPAYPRSMRCSASFNLQRYYLVPFGLLYMSLFHHFTDHQVRGHLALTKLDHW